MIQPKLAAQYRERKIREYRYNNTAKYERVSRRIDINNFSPKLTYIPIKRNRKVKSIVRSTIRYTVGAMASILLNR